MMDSWKILEHLEVELQTLEPRRLVALFRVETSRSVKETTYTVSYDEDVFDPENRVHQNMASIIAVQPALSYSIFAKEITFRGVFDDLDRRAIRRQGEMVAKEVYFNRMVEPNLYLVNPVKDQPLPQSKGLLKASLTLTGKNSASTTVPWALWDTYRDRFAVLLSGSSESALTFGLLEDLQKKSYPIWVEEIKETSEPQQPLHTYVLEKYPNTRRIQTNHQKITQWFHQHIHLLRSEQELKQIGLPPFCVWTETSALSCLFPLLKKHQIGRIVTGHGFFTTQKEFAHRQSFSHHLGLYESSYYNDVASSRYYQQKGWSINQFSLLRPLSGVFAAKILRERYPALHQMVRTCTQPKQDSGERCGWCDACRQNIVYSLALGGSPQQEGYDDTQVKHALKSLLDDRTSFHEEELEQLFQLLRRLEKIDAVPKRYAHSKTPISILSPRFTRESSPINAVPNDLREPVLRIYLQYAKTALVRLGRGWSEFDPLTNEQFHTPYPFEVQTEEIPLDAPKLTTQSSRKTHWGDLTWLELKKHTEANPFAILPVGAIAQHGPHLPLDTGNFLIQELVQRAILACSQPIPIVLPLLPYGVSYHHSDFPGTLEIHNDTLVRLVYEIGKSLASNHIKKLLILNGHAGNHPALNEAAQQINRDTGIFVFVDSGESSRLDLLKYMETPNDLHAGELHTSLSLSSRPQMVQSALARRMVPKVESRYLSFTGQRSIPWHTRIKQISYNGIVGDPTKATTEKGDQYWTIILSHTLALIEDIKAWSLDTRSVMEEHAVGEAEFKTPTIQPEEDNDT